MNALPLANASKFRVLVLKSFISRDSLIRKAFFSENQSLAMKDICEIYHYTQRYYTRQTLACIGKAIAKECLTKAHSFVSEGTKMGPLLRCIDPQNISVSLSEDEKYALLVSSEQDECKDEKAIKKPENIFVVFALNICKDMLSLQLEELNACVLENLQNNESSSDGKQDDDTQLTELCTSLVKEDAALPAPEKVEEVCTTSEEPSSEFLSSFVFEQELPREEIPATPTAQEQKEEYSEFEHPLEISLPEVCPPEDDDFLMDPFYDDTFEDERLNVQQDDLLELIQGRNLKRDYGEEEESNGTKKKGRRKRQKTAEIPPLLVAQ